MRRQREFTLYQHQSEEPGEVMLRLGREVVKVEIAQGQAVVAHVPVTLAPTIDLFLWSVDRGSICPECEFRSKASKPGDRCSAQPCDGFMQCDQDEAPNRCDTCGWNHFGFPEGRPCEYQAPEITMPELKDRLSRKRCPGTVVKFGRGRAAPFEDEDAELS